jgi:hypothetical protein
MNNILKLKLKGYDFKNFKNSEKVNEIKSFKIH